MVRFRTWRAACAALASIGVAVGMAGVPSMFAAAAVAPIGTANGGAPAVRQFSNVPTLGGCKLFPGNNTFNVPITDLPVRPESAATIARTNAQGQWGKVRFTFWSEPTSGMHPIVVPAGQPVVPIVYDQYPEESDPGPFPIPLDAMQEDNGDKHIIVVQEGTCKFYELWATSRSAAGWAAGTGAVWNLASNATRPNTWTSADAAGLPILPGLLRYEEVAAGRIQHALRIVVGATRRAYIWPATHQVGGNDPYLFPMGARLRLRGDYDISQFTGQSRVIAEALKNYGVIVADQGPNWMISGVGDARWDDRDMNQIRNISLTDFEYVDNGPVTVP